MRARDSLSRFVFENLSVRGEITHLDAAWRAVLERRDYPPVVRRLLGEAMAATALLYASIKFQGLLSLQMQGQGPLRLLLVQCTGEGNMRGLARWQGPVREAPLAALCEQGTLMITLDPGGGRDRYQGIVSLAGDSLSSALEHYFEHSEQLPTRLHLTANEQTAAGLLLQRLPGETLDHDAWNRIEALGATLTKRELLDLDAQAIIRRLFYQEDVRLFEARTMAFRCTCSRERTASMLRALGYEEIQSILDEQGRVSVECEFCGMCYEFDPVDAKGLFTAAVAPQASKTQH